jgi:DNA-binding transcriptional MerR regulator
MTPTPGERASADPAQAAGTQPAFRSGAVARLAQMPVATLRVWEQRYQAVQPTTAASGHRLYSAADVQRVLLLRQLTEQGHAIGTIATLNAEQLQAVASTLTAARPATGATGAKPAQARTQAALRVAVVGRALAARLQRASVQNSLARPARLVAILETAGDLQTAPAPADLLLLQTPGLQDSVPPEVSAALAASGARRLAVVYRFAGAAAQRAWARTGAVLLREPAEDEALGSWLATLESALAADALAQAQAQALATAPSAAYETQADSTAAAPADAAALVPLVPLAAPPRRYDDATLTAIAGLSPTVACECPRHVAELLMQLSNFETYSAECLNRSPADAELHAYLQRVAGSARALFETALERVARQEGLPLP